MGSQGIDVELTSAASVLVIDQGCENDQLLVSLCRNGLEWLSPVGWTDQKKVTLLDCRSLGGKTEIDIPAEFSRDIKNGDLLVLRCSELDLEQEIIWTENQIETRNAPETLPAAGLANGIFSRFKAPKAEPVEDLKSEAERRAEDANRAAENFKMKMEAATLAKEEAQRKALEAAREAEAALKMEAERIAEMERAAKAFEEAERLKQDELRRVEEERRAEEERQVEEQRRIEAARKREVEAKLEAERKAVIERYETALDVTHNEELRLKERLEKLKLESQDNEERNFAQATRLAELRKDIEKTETTVETRRAVYEKNAIKLEKAATDLESIQTQSESWDSDRQALAIRLSQAEVEYNHAQQEAEAARLLAEEKRTALEELHQEDTEISGKIENLAETLETKNRSLSEVTVKTQKLQAKYEVAQAEHAQTMMDIEALDRDEVLNSEAEQNLRLEIEATQQAIEDTQEREATHRKAIAHLEAGGDPAEVTEITFDPSRYDALATEAAMESTSNFTYPGEDDAGFADRFLGRVRSTFARDKDAEISIDVDDVTIDMDEVDPVLFAGVQQLPSFARRHSTSLMAIGAVIGGIAILGAGYSFNKSAGQEKLQVKSTEPLPTQVASVATKIEPPIPVLADTSTVEMIEAIPVEAITPKVKPKAKATLPAVETPEMVTPKAKDVETVKEAALKVPVTLKKHEIKTPELVTPQTLQNEVFADRGTLGEEQEIKNYPEATRDIQTRLADLGLYTGPLNGERDAATVEAIDTFNALFSNADKTQTTAGLLTELRRVQHEQKRTDIQKEGELQNTMLLVPEQTPVAEPVLLASNAPTVELFDTVQAVPSIPVAVDSLPAASPYEYEAPVTQEASSVVSDALASEPITPEPAVSDAIISETVTKLASLPSTVEPVRSPVVDDVIVAPKLLKNASADYPSVAQRRGYFANVTITVTYDINASGKVENMKVASNDHEGRFNESFEKEALKAVKKLKFAPKTVNGTPVRTDGKMKRIVFRVE